MPKYAEESILPYTIKYVGSIEYIKGFPYLRSKMTEDLLLAYSTDPANPTKVQEIEYKMSPTMWIVMNVWCSLA
jgi:hypothetical protein